MSEDDYERRLTLLEDVEAIRRRKCEYAEALDRVVNDSAPADEVTAFCTPDCVWDWQHFGVFSGRAAINGFIDAFTARVTFGLHYVLGQLIDVSSDRRTATGEWQVWAPLTLDGTASVLAGGYRDDYVRGDSGWLISSSVLEVKLLFPYQQGWAPDRVPRDWRW